MNENVVKFKGLNEKETKEFFLKVKWRLFKEKVKRKFYKFTNACKDMISNRPEVFTALIGLFATLLGGMFKILSGRKRLKANEEEKRLKENYYFDPKKRHYVETKRKLSGKEVLELDRRYEKGENYSEILNDMGLLK